ncbi:DUF305 domain-containing protein [Herbiconiux sp. YIM B11900]|uniref:DUF305 domain-containing protein n=1 Tax=Herbiconiux sp. YIM B11900 TaxID=3404131 RepID=UPI003F82416E
MRNTLMIAGALAATLTLAGCAGSGSMPGMDHGGSGSATSAPSAEAGTFNDQDVTFAQMMTAHHEQAIEMADMLLAKTGVEENITQLAEKIKAAQQPEIDTMTDWLASWGASTDSMSGMDHGSDGMMSADDMTALEQASGADAGKLFLEQMIQHHQGAIEMAQTEVDLGENADAVALAEKIVTDQTAEITEMQSMIDAL